MTRITLYKSMWIFLITVASICDAIRRAIANVCFFCTYYWHPLDGYNISKDIQIIEKCKPDLTKIPRHLSVIIGSEEVCPQILSKIAVYALVADVDYISFYDTKESFSLDDIKIYPNISTHKMHDGRFIWSMPNYKRKSGLLKYKNGMEKSIEVLSLSYKEGKPLLAEICRELFVKRHLSDTQKAIKDKSNLADLIGDILKKKLDNLPEIDLAIIFDKTICTYGLLPWHTGFTEFHSIETAKAFSVHSFARILYKFSKCEQRFGK